MATNEPGSNAANPVERKAGKFVVVALLVITSYLAGLARGRTEKKMTEYAALHTRYEQLDREYAGLKMQYDQILTQYPSLRDQYQQMEANYASLKAQYDRIEKQRNSQGTSHPRNQD
ncbi:MAG TPA: hypothetical protein VFA67_10985 [Candidatus Sulfotelmatobacter sp.]|nr:hypothetical protein [Candidatus Sulfotelmatobacter sp.]